MHLKRASVAIVCVILLSVIAPKGFEDTQKIQGLSRDSPAPAYPDHVDRMVEQIWSNCGLDLTDTKEVIKSFDFSALDGLIGDSADFEIEKLFTRISSWEALALESPELKHMLLDCLSKQKFQLCASGDDPSTRNRYAEFLESFYAWHPFSRRHLVGQSFQVKKRALEQTAPFTDSPPTPGAGVEPSRHDRALESSPVPSDSIPDPSPGDFLQPKSPDSSAEPDSSSHNKAKVRPVDNNQNNSTRSVVIAVVLSMVGISIVALCLFFCYNGCFRNKDDLEIGQRDDRPLLNLSLSEYSGSSHKSLGLANSFGEEKFGPLSFKSDRVQNGHALSSNRLSEAPISASNRLSEARISASNHLSEAPISATLSGISNSSIELSNILSNTPVSEPASSSSSELSDPSNNAPAPPPPPSPPLKPPPTRKVDAAAPPAPPPPLPNLKPGPRPPPPPKGVHPPRPPSGRPSPPGPPRPGDASGEQLGADGAPRTKLKPFFWDKVSANTDETMVWHQIKAGSFQFNEEMIETLFGYNASDKNKSDGKKKELSSGDQPVQLIQILDKKKSQNVAISLKAMNVKTDEVCDALFEGNELPVELLHSLLRMAPTTDEELKLRLYTGNPSLLGPAERFLKVLVDIPFAFKRMNALLFMTTLEEDTHSIKESFATLEVACKELRSSRLFLKLLEAVLKTGNRMNDGTFRGGAQAFKLDTLLKLADVKGIDGKTTLLHFVVQEIIRTEGVRAVRMARESGSISSLSLNSDDFIEDSPQETGDHYRNLGLKAVSGLSSELENVKKVAGFDADALTSSAACLGHRLVTTKEFLNTDMQNLGEESGFHHCLKLFIEHAEADITSLLEEEKRMRALVKSTTDYFHGNAGKDEGLRLFVIVRDFLGMIDKTCKEVRESSKKVQKPQKPRETPKISVPDPKQLLFPAIRDRRVDSSSSDDEGP